MAEAHTQELAMAASILIEEERGTYTRSPHPHNGYYAGDFRTTRSPEPPPSAIALRVTGTSTVR
jgi:hypothetical protein